MLGCFIEQGVPAGVVFIVSRPDTTTTHTNSNPKANEKTVSGAGASNNDENRGPSYKNCP
jgi:hypothetical protein